VPNEKFVTLPDEEVDKQRRAAGVRPHIVAQVSDYPLLGLSDRQFELLAHALLQANAIKEGGYDRASILAEGADRGRDILLFLSGAVVGVAQCKRYARKLGLGDVLTELLKFALFAIRGPDSIDVSTKRFRYMLWTASGLTEEARNFFDSSEMARSVIANQAPNYIDRARGAIVALSKPTEKREAEAELSEAIRIAASFSLEHYGPPEIGPAIFQNVGIRRWFFRSPDDGPPRAGLEEVERLVQSFRTERLFELEPPFRSASIPYVRRKNLSEAFDHFLASESRVFVLVGGSGQGKTSWVAQLLKHMPDGYSVDVIRGEDIAASDTVLTQTMARMLLARRTGGVPTHEFAQSIWDWLDSNNRIVIVDGLDRLRSDVCERAADWIRQSVALTRQASLRVVITSRRETWFNIASQLREVTSTIYRSDSVNQGGQLSFELGNLDSDEADWLYSAYGLPVRIHGRKHLPTPALIAVFSKLKSEEPQSIITRADVMFEDLSDLKRELRAKPGVGMLGSELLIDELGQALLRSRDGYVTPSQLTRSPAAEAALEGLLSGDRASISDGRIRLGSDDLTEALMGRKLDPDTAVAELASKRGEPLFIGAVAMMMARMERDNPDTVPDLLNRILADAPKGPSPQLDAVARSILELRVPERTSGSVAAAVNLWNESNFLLVVSNLAALLSDVALPALDRFSLMRPLCAGEEADDWRDKYWLNPSTPGRFVTPFAYAASRAIAEDAKAIIPEVFEMIAKGAVIERAVARGLLYEASVFEPAVALAGSWAMLDDDGQAFSIVACSVPEAAARFLATVSLDTKQARYEVVQRLRRIAHGVFDEPISPNVSQAITAAADSLIVRIVEPTLEAQAIIVRLRQEKDEDLRNRLLELWSSVPDDDYWHGIGVVGPDSRRLLSDLLEGRDVEHGAYRLIAELPAFVLSEFGMDDLISMLEAFADRGHQHSRSVARAVETVLYNCESAEGHTRLWQLAVRLAGSSDGETRLPLTYYAGSACKAEVLERRDLLFQILINHESGENLRPIVWKLIQSSPERANSVPRLVQLVERLGRAAVMSEINRYSFLPETKPILVELAKAHRS
jgi:hypothetical protein